MSYETMPAKQFKDIIKATFPDYRKRTVVIAPREKVTFHDVNWSGGTRSEYRACSIDGKRAEKTPHMGLNAPWNNPYSGLTIDLPVNTVIVEGGYFCGKKRQLYIYVHPANMPLLLK